MSARDLDFLVDFKFHLFDVSPAIPNLFPFVLNPSIGFASITAPSLTLEKKRIVAGNAYYPHTTILRAQQNTLVLTRGASLQDGDFWRWYVAALTGDTGSLTTMPGKRKTLLLVHFSLSQSGSIAKDFDERQAQKQAGAGLFAPGSVKTFAFIGRVPSRAWLLYDCHPAGYKVASDFNANSNNVSLREMGLDYTEIDEVRLDF